MRYWEGLNSKDLLTLNEARLGADRLRPTPSFFYVQVKHVKDGNLKFSLNLSRVAAKQFLDIPMLNIINRSFGKLNISIM